MSAGNTGSSEAPMGKDLPPNYMVVGSLQFLIGGFFLQLSAPHPSLLISSLTPPFLSGKSKIPGPSDKRAGGGGEAEPRVLLRRRPSTARLSRPAPSTTGPNPDERRERPQRQQRPRGCCGGAAGRLPPSCAAQTQEREVGGAGSSASRVLRGSGRLRSARPGPSGRGGCSAKSSGLSPCRCGDSAAPRRRPCPRPARRPRRGGHVQPRKPEERARQAAPDRYIEKSDSVTISVWNHKKIHKKQGAGFLRCVRLLSSAINHLKDTGWKSKICTPAELVPRGCCRRVFCLCPLEW
nr:translation initiation factor IF-2-like [Gorilla gorilla gorilla]